MSYLNSFALKYYQRYLYLEYPEYGDVDGYPE